MKYHNISDIIQKNVIKEYSDMEEYEKPVIEIVYIDRTDIITASDNEGEQIEMTNNTTNP